MDNKQLMIIAAGIVVVAFIAIAATFIVLNNNNNSPATPTPAPSVTPAPTGTTPTAKPSVAATPTVAPGGPIIVQVNANRTSGMSLVSIYLNKDATPIDVSKLTMNIVCNGQTYTKVWSMKAADWGAGNGNSLLEPNEVITAQVDTGALGVPQGQPLTFQVLQDGAVLQETTVTPS